MRPWRPITIDIDALSRALDTPDTDHYLDLTNGRIVLLDDAVTDIRSRPAGEENPENLLPIEPLSTADKLTIMQAFLPDVADPHVYQALNNALNGRRPQKAFHYRLMPHPEIQAQWHAFQHERLQELALDWLTAHELEPVHTG